MKVHFAFSFITLIIFSTAVHADSCMSEMRKRAKVLREKLTKKEVQPFKISDDGRTLYLNGDMDSFGSQFKKEFLDDLMFSNSQIEDMKKRSNQIQFLVINSPGGRTDVMDGIVQWVKEKGSALKVIVPENGICASACAEIFRCAKNRVANESAYLMFHGASYDKPTDATHRDVRRGNRKASRENLKSERSDCAEAARNTRAGVKISEGTLMGQDVCFQAPALAKQPGEEQAFLEVERSGTGAQGDLIKAEAQAGR